MKRGIYLILLVLISNIAAAQVNPFMQDKPVQKQETSLDIKPPEIEISPSIEEFLCEGCFYNNRCLDIGSQYLINTERLYCDVNKKVSSAKEKGKVCSSNYECISFFCGDSTCTVLKEKENNLFRTTLTILAAAFMALVAFLLIRNRPKKPRSAIKIAAKPRTIKPRQRRTEDEMEKQIKSSMEEISKTFRK